jgi:protein transport protein SEC31
MGSEVLCCAWNRKVPHILCSSSNNGMTVVWDLKQQKEVISFKDPANRLRCSSVVWNPDVPTQLLVAYDDDRNPSLQMWDLRNCQYPFKETAAHGKGILAVSWNDMDSNLLLSCGKDNRMIIWCLASGAPELFCEIACPQQTFEGRWAPHKPGLVSAASFAGAVTVHSMMQSQVQTMKYCPKWCSKPSGVSFGFGGKMLSFGKKKEGAGSWCHSLLVPNEPEIVPAADNFESWIAEKKLKDYCVDKVRRSSGQHEELMWQVMSTHFAAEGRTSLPKLLGFDSDQILQKAEQFLGSKPGSILAEKPAETQQQEKSPVANQPAPAPMIDIGDATDFFAQLTETREKKEEEEARRKQEIELQLATAMTAISTPKDETQTDWSGGAELMIKESLLIGNLAAAVECCFKAGKMAEGLLLASGGGNELFTAARTEFLRLKGDAFLTSMGNIMTDDFETLVANANLSAWTETLAILATYSGQQFPTLCERLAQRLEKEKFDTRSAVICYICAGNFPQTVNIWTSQPSQGTQKLALQDLVEKMAVLQDAVKFSQADNVFNSKLTQYADILANSGRTVAAMRYLMLLRDDTSSAILRDRIFNSDPLRMSQTFGGRPQFPFQSVDVRVTYRPPAPQPTPGYAPTHGAPKAPGHPGMPAPGHPGMAPHQQGIAPHPGHPGVGGHPGMPGVRPPSMPAHAPAPAMHHGGPGMHAPATTPAPAHNTLPPAPRMPTAPTMPNAGSGVQPPGYGMTNAPAPMQPGMPGMAPTPGYQPHSQPNVLPPNPGVGVQAPAPGVGVVPPGAVATPYQQPYQQSHIGAPPPGPPKASTAPTASAMPVVEGMPTPWPLPTKTQQIRSTNEAVKGANQAVQEASAYSGNVQQGTPMAPHDVQRVKGLFDQLLAGSPAAQQPRQRDDLAKRLEDLYNKLGAGMCKNTVSEKVMVLVQAIEGQDLATAQKCAAELATMDWDVNKNWVQAVKRLVPTR